jgi:hypothetical protein
MSNKRQKFEMPKFNASSFFKNFARAKPGRYVGGLVLGSMVFEYGKNKLEQLAEAHKGNQELPPPESVSPHDKLAPIIRKLDKRVEKIHQTLPALEFFKGFDVRKWEVPEIQSIRRAKKVVKYSYGTSDQDKQDDLKRAGKEKAKEVIDNIDFSHPIEAIQKGVEHTKELNATYQSIQKMGGYSRLQKRLDSYAETEKSNMIRQLGMNTMLSAPTFLLGGPVGIAVRAFMLAKTIGNLGHGINEMRRRTGKPQGIIMKVIEDRNESKRTETVKKNQ